MMDTFINVGNVGRNVFDIDNFKFDTPLFIDKGDFLPFISVIGNDNMHSTPLVCNYGTKTYNIFYRSSLKISGIHSLHNYGRTVHSFSQYASAIKRGITNFRNMSVETCILPSTRNYNRTTYDRIINTLFNTTTKSYFLQSLREIKVGGGMIYLYNSSKILMTLVVPRNLISYQRMHLILYGKFDPKGMEFWVDETLDIPSSSYKAFRKYYRARIKAKIIEHGIPIVPKRDIISLLTPKIEYPQDSIDELNSWKNKLVESCIEDLRTKEEDANILI